MMATLETVYPELAQEWSRKNLPLTPADVAPKSNKKVWWNGTCGHEWETRIADRAEGHGCPYCRDNKLLSGFNDLETEHPAIAAEWSMRNAPLTPDKVKPKSTQNVWWKCNCCHHEWRAVINSRVKGRCRCPVCEKKRRALENAWKYDKPFRTRMVEEAVVYYAAQAGLVVHRNADPGIGLPCSVYLPEIRAAFEVSRKGRTRKVDRIARSASQGIQLVDELLEGRPNKYSREQMEHALSLLDRYSYNQVAAKTRISRSTLLRAKRKG